ncbi:hypothetical protein VV01_16335 [Luteipulveratus halotolerans]|uniref:Uncharacterized protein n=1 Tax=Luteipulveratus halotolerans TaxID=1631356 RepID=A0A0L6CKV5_9MICO|nr:hypothetical protein VV01_16335 [Luteipulveratus halotolerans]
MLPAWSKPLTAWLRTGAFSTRTDELTGDELESEGGNKEYNVATVGAGGEKNSSDMTLVKAVMKNPWRGGAEMPLVACGTK